MNHVFRLWRGELTLQDAFWNWAVFGGLSVNIVSSVLFLFLISADQLIAAVVFGYAFSLPYNLAVTVGVWRSAERYAGEQRLASLAQIVTAIGFVVLSVT